MRKEKDGDSRGGGARASLTPPRCSTYLLSLTPVLRRFLSSLGWRWLRLQAAALVVDCLFSLGIPFSLRERVGILLTK
jgi:hypothetical protein